MVNISPLSASRIVEAIGGNILRGSTDGIEVTQIGEPLEAGAGGVAFIISESFVRDSAQSRAEVLVVQAAFAERVLAQLSEHVKLVVACKDSYLGLAQVSKIAADADPFHEWRLADSSSEERVHRTAKVDPTAKLGPGVVVGEGAVVGPRTQLVANVVVGPHATVGSDCVLFPGVVVYPRTQVGSRVRLHANVVLGSDGFGYARGPQGSVKIWHLGRVVVGDDVEIGAGSMVDRGTLKDTVIERGAKLDNLVQVGHNVLVKSHAILCAQVGMAGNSVVGMGAILAGKAGVADKVEIGDGAIVGPMSGLSKDVKAGEVVMGQQPAKPRREWWKLIALFERLPELYDRVKKLEQKQ